jgi:hypothetical protein
MSQQNTPAGWYPDPTGRNELRYFNAHWTEQVATRGVTAIDPLPAPTLARTGRGSSRVKLAVAGGVIALAVGITLAVTLSGGGSGGHGFCNDVAALGSDYPSKLSAADLKNGAKLSEIASRFDALAAESPSPQDAADLRYVATWLRKVAGGNYAGIQASEPRLVAASDRVTTYIDDTCPGLYVG